jgi:hypothetical protein
MLRLTVIFVNCDSEDAPVSLEPKADVAIKGKQAQLTCEANGNPPVIYEWYKVSQLTSVLHIFNQMP